MRQSLRIIKQCLDNMPEGDHKADHPLTTPPRRKESLHDIETLINHFLSVSWGPVIPPNEVSVAIEATKGINSYYLVSDGSTTSYRTRIRTPVFCAPADDSRDQPRVYGARPDSHYRQY